MKKVVAGLVLLTVSSSAFAVCEHERKERNDFQSHADTASRVATLVCAGGSFFTLVTFGASLIPCAAAVATAENQKRILGEKENNLQNCLNTDLRKQKVAADAEDMKKLNILRIHNAIDFQREVYRNCYQEKLTTAQGDFVREGYDLTNEDVQGELNDILRDIQTELDALLAEGEIQRAAAIARES